MDGGYHTQMDCWPASYIHALFTLRFTAHLARHMTIRLGEALDTSNGTMNGTHGVSLRLWELRSTVARLPCVRGSSITWGWRSRRGSGG